MEEETVTTTKLDCSHSLVKKVDVFTFVLNISAIVINVLFLLFFVFNFRIEMTGFIILNVFSTSILIANTYRLSGKLIR